MIDREVGSEADLEDEIDFEVMLDSKKRYAAPTPNMRKPAIEIIVVLSTLITGRVVNVLSIRQPTVHVAISFLFCCTKLVP